MWGQGGGFLPSRMTCPVIFTRGANLDLLSQPFVKHANNSKIDRTPKNIWDVRKEEETKPGRCFFFDGFFPVCFLF